ncbi:hypothetical protein GN956_G2084 [Arapaima gigas]
MAEIKQATGSRVCREALRAEHREDEQAAVRLHAAQATQAAQAVMPFRGLAGLKEQVLKPGKEEVKNAMGNSLGHLQR